MTKTGFSIYLYMHASIFTKDDSGVTLRQKVCNLALTLSIKHEYTSTEPRHKALTFFNFLASGPCKLG